MPRPTLWLIGTLLGLALGLVPLGPPASPHPAPTPATPRTWLSIPRLGFRAQTHLHILPNGTRLATVATPWLWTLQAPHKREQPIPFPGDEIDAQHSRLAFHPRARFYTQRVLTIGPCTQRCVRQHLRLLLQRPWPPHTLLLQHCGLTHGIPACTLVITW